MMTLLSSGSHLGQLKVTAGRRGQILSTPYLMNYLSILDETYGIITISPQLMTWLDVGGQRSRSHLFLSMWWRRHHVNAGRGVDVRPSSRFICILLSYKFP